MLVGMDGMNGFDEVSTCHVHCGGQSLSYRALCLLRAADKVQEKWRGCASPSRYQGNRISPTTSAITESNKCETYYNTTRIGIDLTNFVHSSYVSTIIYLYYANKVMLFRLGGIIRLVAPTLGFIS